MSMDNGEEEEEENGEKQHSKRHMQDFPVASYVLELVGQASKEYHSVNRHLDYEKLEKHVLSPSKYFRKFTKNHAIY